MWQQLAEYFAEDVEKLSRLLTRDFSHWLVPLRGGPSTKIDGGDR